MQAAIASLLEIEYDEVPDFIRMENPNGEVMQFLLDRGYDPCYLINRDLPPSLKECLEFDGAEYFFASVKSQTYKEDEEAFHAVIIDKHLNVVHDPNPNQLCIGIDESQISNVLVLGNWYIDTDRNLIRG